MGQEPGSQKWEPLPSGLKLRLETSTKAALGGRRGVRSPLELLPCTWEPQGLCSSLVSVQEEAWRKDTRMRISHDTVASAGPRRGPSRNGAHPTPPPTHAGALVPQRRGDSPHLKPAKPIKANFSPNVQDGISRSSSFLPTRFHWSPSRRSNLDTVQYPITHPPPFLEGAPRFFHCSHLLLRLSSRLARWPY